LALEKSYSNGVARVDLAWLMKNTELGHLGPDTDLLEGLVRFTKTNKRDDDVTGVNSTIFNDLQGDAIGLRAGTQTDPSLNNVNRVKGVMANGDLAARFRPLGRVTTDLRSADGHFLDTDVRLSGGTSFEVLDLAGGAVVTRTRSVPDGAEIVFECKALATDSWDAGSITGTGAQVLNGFVHVDPTAVGRGESLLAVTPDILATPEKLVALLGEIKGLEGYRDRAAIILLPKRAVGAGSYANDAYGLIRRLVL